MTTVHHMWTTPFRPNGLQASPDGLWVMAQSTESTVEHTDTHAYLLKYEDGSIIHKVQTTMEHAGGITVADDYLWVTAGYELAKIDLDGNIAARYLAPGGAGAHGIEYVGDKKMWVSDPRTFYNHLIDLNTMKGIRSVPYTKGQKGHGIFVKDGSIWQGITRKDFGGGEIHRIDISSEKKLDHIHVPDPEIHGMSYHEGLIWFCCARTHKICTLPLPG